jgi:hypothetical protein
MSSTVKISRWLNKGDKLFFKTHRIFITSTPWFGSVVTRVFVESTLEFACEKSSSLPQSFAVPICSTSIGFNLSFWTVEAGRCRLVPVGGN